MPKLYKYFLFDGPLGSQIFLCISGLHAVHDKIARSAYAVAPKTLLRVIGI